MICLAIISIGGVNQGEIFGGTAPRTRDTAAHQIAQQGLAGGGGGGGGGGGLAGMFGKASGGGGGGAAGGVAAAFFEGGAAAAGADDAHAAAKMEMKMAEEEALEAMDALEGGLRKKLAAGGLTEEEQADLEQRLAEIVRAKAATTAGIAAGADGGGGLGKGYLYGDEGKQSSSSHPKPYPNLRSLTSSSPDHHLILTSSSPDPHLILASSCHRWCACNEESWCNITGGSEQATRLIR